MSSKIEGTDDGGKRSDKNAMGIEYEQGDLNAYQCWIRLQLDVLDGFNLASFHKSTGSQSTSSTRRVLESAE